MRCEGGTATSLTAIDSEWSFPAARTVGRAGEGEGAEGRTEVGDRLADPRATNCTSPVYQPLGPGRISRTTSELLATSSTPTSTRMALESSSSRATIT